MRQGQPIVTDRPRETLEGIATHRRAILQGFLWAFLGVVVATIVGNGVILGRRGFTLSALTPNLIFFAVLCVALWLNHRGHFRWALGLIMGLTGLASALPILFTGVENNEIVLFLFFIPIVLAGLLLNRVALYLIAGSIIAVAMGVPIVRYAGVALTIPAGGADARVFAAQFSIIFAMVVFVLDRFGLTLQHALRTSVVHANALQEALTEKQRAEAALLDAKNYSDAIIGSLPGIFYVADRDGRFDTWNDRLGSVLGYSDEELSTLRPADMIVEPAPSELESELALLPESADATLAATFVTKDGAQLPYILSASKVSMAGDDFVVGIGIDKSELDAAQSHIRQLDEELQERLERITALHEIDKAITGSLDLNLTLGVVLQQITKRLNVDAACILLHKHNLPTLRYGASIGFNTNALRDTNLRLGDGVAGRVGLNRELAFIADPAEFAQAFVRSKEVTREGFQNYLAVPLVAKGHLLGVLELFHRSQLKPGYEWFAFLETLATQAAIALDSATLFDDLERSNLELLLAYDTTIEGWARALDLRDEETVGHSRRVTDMTLALAERMGIGSDELIHIRRGALLHDIGKMGVPDNILLKPGKLTPEEWHVMRQHTDYAFELLAPIPFLRPAIDIPYSHHERWDGSGYPRGLMSDRIPVAARIFAVVDVYDALTNDRPYRKAWTVERALDFIRANSGTHFDPASVEAFLTMLKERATPTRF